MTDKSTQKFLQFILKIQRKYALWICLSCLVLGVIAFKPAIGLLKSVSTDLIHLLPDQYPSVQLSKEIRKKFNKKSRLHMIIESPDPKTNRQLVIDLKAFLEKRDDVELAEIDKKGYDFFDRYKLLLIDLKDLYAIHDRIEDKIQKEKLGPLYIDLEDEGEKKGTFDEFLQKYKAEFTDGVQSEHFRNEDGTVYVLNITSSSPENSIGYFKKFGRKIIDHVETFNFSKYPTKVNYGYAGAIMTRVDQYDALIEDLKRAGIFSAVSIFILLYIYFTFFVRHSGVGFRAKAVTFLIRFVPVFLIFIPMIVSTLLAFAFNSIFFERLNMVTSFLFAIIFGLGVDIGIHLISRFVQDRGRGMSLEKTHEDVLFKTGKSAAIGILTTVASFYIMTFTDFKGFSEFGFIAGNGLVIALASYLIFFPSFLILADRLKLLRYGNEDKPQTHEKKWVPYAKPILIGLILLTIVSGFFATKLEFEWNLNKLSMKLEHREYWKEHLRTVLGRVNSAAAYLIENEVEARAIGREIRERLDQKDETPSVHYYRSYYDMVPLDQDEKLYLLEEIDKLLEDDALNVLGKDDRKLVDDFRQEIKLVRKVTKQDIDPEVHNLFWGENGGTEKSLAFVMPLPNMQLANGNNAREFYNDAHKIDVLGKRFYAISDAMIFAEVIITLFRDSRLAISLAGLALIFLISLHFRHFKKVLFIFVGLGSGVFWMLGLMHVFQLKLNFYNMIIIPAVMGMGVDNSVHLTHRYDEGERQSIREALRTSGGAALMASLTTILGYAGLCFARHPGLTSIGWMAIIGMLTCLIGSLVVLPLLLQVFLRGKNASSTKRKG